jgi:putative addiction module CopG family antidote
MTIALSPETQRLLDERLKAGGYASPDDAVRAGLLLLRQERDNAAALAEVKAKLQRGAAQADRGELVDPDEVLKKIEALKPRRVRRAG